MKLSAILAPMIEAGVSGTVILETVRAFEAAHENAADQSREKARARWHKWNEKRRSNASNVSKRLQTAANVSNPLARVEDIYSNLEDTGSTFSEAKASSNEPRAKRASVGREHEIEFHEQFWPVWPNKADKKKAARAFIAARRLGVALADILEGVERYKRHKPQDRQWMNGATFLNGERWLDEYAPAGPRLVHPAPNSEQERPKTASEVIEERRKARQAGLL